MGKNRNVSSWILQGIGIPVLIVFSALNGEKAEAEPAGVNRAPAVVSAGGRKFYPGDCSYPRNSFVGADWKDQREKYDDTMAEVDRCTGGLAFVTPIGDGNDWHVICVREFKSPYVMDIPESIRNSGKRFTVFNRSERGTIFGVDQLPKSSSPAGKAAYFQSMCTENASVNFQIQECKTLSFEPTDYKSGKTPEAFLIGLAGEDCEKIAFGKDVLGSQKRLINRPNLLSDLTKCGPLRR